jgi:hypothetical protein
MTMTIPDELDSGLSNLAKLKGMTESALICMVLAKFLQEMQSQEIQPVQGYDLGEPKHNSFELAKKYILDEGSGIGDLSTTYKQRLREEIAIKLDSRRLGSSHSAL